MYNVGWFKWHFFFQSFEIGNFCFVVAVLYLVHDVEAIHDLC